MWPGTAIVTPDPGNGLMLDAGNQKSMFSINLILLSRDQIESFVTVCYVRACQAIWPELTVYSSAP